jgi:hypothetical protein
VVKLTVDCAKWRIRKKPGKISLFISRQRVLVFYRKIQKHQENRGFCGKILRGETAEFTHFAIFPT